MKQDGMLLKLIPESEIPENIRSDLSGGPSRVIQDGQMLYFSLGKEILCCEKSAESSRLMYLLAQQSIPELDPETPENAFRQLLVSPDPHAPAERLMQLRIQDQCPRTVVLFRTDAFSVSGLYASLCEMIPGNPDDYIVPLDLTSVAVIRNCRDEEEDDTAEFAAAVIETAESEGIAGIRAGIGTVKAGLAGLRESCREAESALKTGKRFQPDARVLRYSESLLERIVETIPASQRAAIRDEFTERCGNFALNPELTETVEVFFRNDLNLTAASKQLFIHRNTLNYRLDRIRAKSGLDLRRFRDAAAFRVMMDILNDSNPSE